MAIVTTIQPYRIRDERSGEGLAATRRIYRDDGYLQTAFENLSACAKAELSCDAKGRVDLSLANVLRVMATFRPIGTPAPQNTRLQFPFLQPMV